MARSPYITVEGHQKLLREAEWLWKTERPRVTREVGEAAAQGDRSENAEYIYGKKRLREIDRRLGWLSRRLDELTVVTEVPREQNRVFFGVWVTLEDEAGDEITYRIVGPDESDAERGYISIDSPVGLALLRREQGDEVTVRRPRGEAVFYLAKVWFE